ncbi:hypothetical protein IKE71_04325, partial [Candidatus Saccharibacteria bacterium]|nr:hypothetical protein [Candidatus Saccharibacteria bacterium]
MQPNQQLGKLKETIFIGRLLKGSIVAMAVFAFGFMIIPALIAEASAASDISAGVRWGSVFLTLDPDKAATDAGTSAIGDAGHGDIDFDELIPSQNSGDNYGTLKVAKKTISVTSSGQYYSVYLSTNSDNNNLNLNIGESATDTSVRIPALASTFASPVAFSGSGWGFAVPCDTTAQAGATCMSDANWVTPTLLDTQMTSTTSLDGASSTYNNTIWAGVPNNTNAVQIWKAQAQGSAGVNYGFGSYERDGSTVTGDTTNDHFDIYYAVAVDTNTLAGTYSNEIVYTAIASASSLDAVSTNMQSDKNFGAAKDVMTLKFDLNESTVSIDESDILIKIVPHQTMISEEYEIANLTASDYQTCPVVQDSLDFSTNAYAEIKCKLPKGLNVEDGSGNGGYDFWMYVDGYGYNYISRDVFEGTQVATFYSVGLQSKYPTGEGTYANGDTLNPGATTATSRAGNLIVTKMQEMSNGICNNTNAWASTTFVNGNEVSALGSSAILYDYTGTGKALFSGVPTYSSTVNQTTGGDLGLGSFALTDNRDNKLYLVRRLADGNCWMVQNLDLNLASFAGTQKLTSENTDLNSKSYWDPQAKLLKDANTTGLSTALSTKFGFAQTAQFQSGDQRNTDVEPQYSWGSTSNTGSGNSATTYLSTTVYNSADAAYARSYDNVTYGYVPTNQTDGSQTNTIGNLTERSATDGLNSYKTSGWSSLYANQYVGDYYNWYATTAESGTFTQSSGNAEDSICPKGWQLPENGGDTSGSKSWYGLIVGAYGQVTNDNGGTSGSTEVTASEVNIKKFPISLVRSGRYYWADSNLDNRGSYGYFWSSTAAATAYSRDLEFWGGTLYPQSGSGKASGSTVRCLAHGDELTNSAQVIASQDNDTVSTCGAGKICYDKNGGTGTMTDQSASASSSITLTAPSFTRLGYAFAGWSTTENGLGGELYGPNETITTPSTLGSTGLQLYAKWLPASTQYTMQTFNTAACSNLGMHQTIALRDERDNNVYTVAKLKDDNCWMTSNLALNLADFAGHTTSDSEYATNPNWALTPANTDLNSTTAVSRGYWDPSESMRTLAEEIVA